MHKRWLTNKTNPEFIEYVSKSAAISPIFAQVLINRGLKSAADIAAFLNPGITGLSDPFDLPGMRAAVDRIKSAALRNDVILVHGDYDTDGLTATAILVDALRKIGLDVRSFIPNRLIHGYGFNRRAVDEAKKLGVKLIITVDCGIGSFDAAAHAAKEGIDIIITDHHEPTRKSKIKDQKSEARDQEFLIPDAVAVINPKISNLKSQILSGAGIAFKVAQALAMEDKLGFSEEDCLSLLDLAAIGTIADVVPLTGENRIIIKEGLKYIHDACRPGVKTLKEVCGLNSRELKAGLLAFTMVPRINAAGRIADSGDVIRLFLTDKYDEAMDLSSWLDGLNSERQKIEEGVYREAAAKLESVPLDSVIVLAGEGWHQGVLGIVASRIAEEFCRPTFILSTEDGVAKGSARSVPSFDICAGLAECEGLLLSFGGHRQAAGIKLAVENIQHFEKKIVEIIRKSVTEEDMTGSVEIDTVIKLTDVTHGLLKEFAMLEPFGYCNPEPLLGSKGIEVLSPRVVGNNHLKMKLCQRSCRLDAIGFNMGALFDSFDNQSSIDAVFTPAINEWNGNKYIQLVLKAIRPA